MAPKQTNHRVPKLYIHSGRQDHILLHSIPLPLLYPASTLRGMGNINEKNVPTAEEKDVRRSLLEPIKHLDPWTDETEERAVEAALLHDIEINQSPSPPSKRFQRANAPLTSAATCFLMNQNQDLSSGQNASSYELVAFLGENSDLPREKNELFEETGNISLPLSESIIPESFEVLETTISPPFTCQKDIPVSIKDGIRSLDTVEESTEHTALLNLGSRPSQEYLYSPSPEPFNEFRADQMGKMPETTTTLGSIASDRAAAITEQVMETSSLALATNSLLVTPHQINDIPIAPVPPLFTDEPLGELTTILSPLVLGLSTLANVNDMEFSCQSETERNKNLELPSLPESPRKELINFEDAALDTVENPISPHVTPFAPRREIVPLPPLSTENSANLLVSEIPSLEPSGLGLIVPMLIKPVSSIAHLSTASLHIFDDAAESNRTPGEVLSPPIVSLDGTSEFSEELASQFEAQLSIRPSAVEGEKEILQATISILNLDGPDDVIPGPPCQAAQDAELLPQSSQEAQAVTLEANAQASSFAIPKIRTCADATGIATKYSEVANVVSQAPLTSQRPVTSIDQSTHKIGNREGDEHSPGRPYWVKGSVEKDIDLISSSTAPSRGSVRSCIHTPDTPNWAIAPVLDSIPSLKSGKSHGGRGRRRGKKTRMSQGNGSNLEDSQLTSESLKPVEVARPVSLKLVKDESFLSTPLPRDQLISSEELRKITITNRQKVNNWISESASVMGCSKSSADREPRAMASRSASLMDSRSERVNDGLLCVDGDKNLEKANLLPASRIAEALIAQEHCEKSLNDSVLIKDDHGSTRTPGSIPTTIVNDLVQGHSSSEEDRKANLSKGKKNSVRSPTPSARRSRSASIVSSLASGVSVKSGVSASSRLFQRAIEEIGSKNGSLPNSGTPDSATCHTLLERQHIEARGIFNTVVQAFDPPARKTTLLGKSMPINAVTETETETTRVAAALRVKGKIEAVASSYQSVESTECVGSNDERFLFTFKPPQASISKDDKHAYMGSQNDVSMLVNTPVRDTAVQASGSQQGGKTPRPTSSKTFIPAGRYVPPPIRSSEMFRHGQASATIRGKEVMSGTSAPIQQTKVPRLSWPCADADAATLVTITPGMNVYAPRFRSLDDVSASSFNYIRNDVMPDVRMHFGTGNDPSGGVQPIFQEEFTVLGHYANYNSGSSLASMPHTASTVQVNRSGSGVRSRGAMTPLDLPEVDQKQGIPNPQIQMNALVSQQQLDEYMAKLSLAQKRLQANMDDIVTSCYGKADPIVATSKIQNLEQASREDIFLVILFLADRILGYLGIL
ncbi:hypothetical protein AGABI2DRAFT_122705 [Agaricus bisporus var. bisporus H97]|uniref:hypothetical protein n=1 Tax=Agaricus bisporus var. bisporus (strain H97 / ATCC MYA-4626 / FGSC 10389) TaxID=936046 RepID=UPI00029F5400|nr:hypothetical protein AGABI2DRAFT_122705 [Agaricus bisporus var. bisporus H97]EKV42480.1 hypothetical protein AGABI2DRAFT_122705 [Agaricus bisporus var. bisporus H97]